MLQRYHTFPKRCVELREVLKFAHTVAQERVGGMGYSGCAGVDEPQRRRMIGSSGSGLELRGRGETGESMSGVTRDSLPATQADFRRRLNALKD